MRNQYKLLADSPTISNTDLDSSDNPSPESTSAAIDRNNTQNSSNYSTIDQSNRVNQENNIEPAGFSTPIIEVPAVNFRSEPKRQYKKRIWNRSHTPQTRKAQEQKVRYIAEKEERDIKNLAKQVEKGFVTTRDKKTTDNQLGYGVWRRKNFFS